MKEECVEIFYDYATKKYGFRVVTRDIIPDKTGWRQYRCNTDERAISMPIEDMKRLIKEAESFVRQR